MSELLRSTGTTDLTAPLPRSGEASGSHALEVRGLRKMFKRADGTTVPAVDGTDLTVEAGEFLVLLGPSGCGKSTFLRCIAGLESPQLGSITLGERVLFDGERGINLPPERRRVSMVFQSYALWPHMSVFRNVAYPLKVRRNERLPKAEIHRRVHEVLDLVGIGHLADQFPAQISGGQQQRVALARALVQGSDVVLFDEPLSNVDARVRDQLRAEIREMQQRIGFTAIYVTHDQEEALSLADRIAVIDAGAIAHLGTPREIFLQPASLKVARFVGNLVEVPGTVIRGTDDALTLSTQIGEISGVPATADLAIGDQAWATWRPDRTLLAHPVEGRNGFTGVVESISFMGNYTELLLKVGEQRIAHRCVTDLPHTAGTEVAVGVSQTDVRILAG